MFYVLACFYGLAGFSGFMLWRVWKRLVDFMSFSAGLTRSLSASYLCLSVSMLCGAAAAAALAAFDWTTKMHLRRSILYILVISFVVQSIVFSFVFTPIAMHKGRQPRGFARVALAAILCFVFPTLILVILCLWFIAHSS